MKSGFLRAMALLLVGAGWAAAQAPTPTGAAPTGATPPAPPAVYPPPAAQLDGPGCLPADPVGPGGHQVYASADYLPWRIRKGNLPTTATVVPVGLLAVDTTGLFQTSPGGPAVPGNVPVTGFTPVSIVSTASTADRGSLDTGEHSGGRFFAGVWADPDQC